MATKKHGTEGALEYLDEQIEALKRHVPAAIGGFDQTAIHQARVATRRLKAGLDLLAPLCEKSAAKPLMKAGRTLRRRLGPLRDLDVVIDHLKSYPAPTSIKPAIEWQLNRMEKARIAAREEDVRDGKPPAKQLAPFEGWWSLRHALAEHSAAIRAILTDALHDGFHQFSLDADRLCGDSGAASIDVHQLRIHGKAVRYLFEIAEADGIRIPKSVFKSFKAMQESLGSWHDCVVLAELTMGESAEAQLAHHDPASAMRVLDLAKLFLRDSAKELGRFKSRWRKSGVMVRRVLAERAPLSRDVSNEISVLAGATQSGTDPDRSAPGSTSPAAPSPQDGSPAT